MGLFSKGSKAVAKAAIGVASVASSATGTYGKSAADVKRVSDAGRARATEVRYTSESRTSHGKSSAKK